MTHEKQPDDDPPTAKNGEPCDCETPGDWHRVANDFQQEMFGALAMTERLREALRAVGRTSGHEDPHEALAKIKTIVGNALADHALTEAAQPTVDSARKAGASARKAAAWDAAGAAAGAAEMDGLKAAAAAYQWRHSGEKPTAGALFADGFAAGLIFSRAAAASPVPECEPGVCNLPAGHDGIHSFNPRRAAAPVSDAKLVCIGCEKNPPREKLEADECMWTENFAGKPLYCDECWKEHRVAAAARKKRRQQDKDAARGLR